MVWTCSSGIPDESPFTRTMRQSTQTQCVGVMGSGVMSDTDSPFVADPVAEEVGGSMSDAECGSHPVAVEVDTHGLPWAVAVDHDDMATRHAEESRAGGDANFGGVLRNWGRGDGLEFVAVENGIRTVCHDCVYVLRVITGKVDRAGSACLPDVLGEIWVRDLLGQAYVCALWDVLCVVHAAIVVG